jgi:hypothetical protein
VEWLHLHRLPRDLKWYGPVRNAYLPCNPTVCFVEFTESQGKHPTHTFVVIVAISLTTKDQK